MASIWAQLLALHQSYLKLRQYQAGILGQHHLFRRQNRRQSPRSETSQGDLFCRQTTILGRESRYFPGSPRGGHRRLDRSAYTSSLERSTSLRGSNPTRPRSATSSATDASAPCSMRRSRRPPQAPLATTAATATPAPSRAARSWAPMARRIPGELARQDQVRPRDRAATASSRERGSTPRTRPIATMSTRVGSRSPDSQRFTTDGARAMRRAAVRCDSPDRTRACRSAAPMVPGDGSRRARMSRFEPARRVRVLRTFRKFRESPRRAWNALDRTDEPQAGGADPSRSFTRRPGRSDGRNSMNAE